VEWRPGDGGPVPKYYLLTDEGHLELQSTANLWCRSTVMTSGIIAGTHTSSQRTGSKQCGGCVMSSASSIAQAESLFGYNRDDLIAQPRADYSADRRTWSVGPDLALSGRYRHAARSPAKIGLSHIDTGDVLWAQGGG
jgi:hypothetical protein